MRYARVCADPVIIITMNVGQRTTDAVRSMNPIFQVRWVHTM